MILIVGFIVGAVWGALQARRREGNRLDMAQYAFGYGVAFALVAVVVALAIENLAG